MSLHNNNSLDRIARVYAFWGRHPLAYSLQDWVTFLGRHRFIRGRAAGALNVGPGDRVMEVACGTGRNFPYLLGAVGQSGFVIGVDYSQGMLNSAHALCKSRGWKNVRLLRCDAAVLDVGEKDFDGILCVLGMSAIPNHTAALTRCRDLLRQGGVLSVCDASVFPGTFARPVNALVRRVYGRLAAWNPDRDLPADMAGVFGNVEVEPFNFGSFFIARSRKA